MCDTLVAYIVAAVDIVKLIMVRRILYRQKYQCEDHVQSASVLAQADSGRDPAETV